MAESRGKPTAVVDRTEIGDRAVDQASQLEERFWRTVDRIRERNADKDPDAELAFITEVVEEVRQERHEREQRTKGDG